MGGGGGACLPCCPAQTCLIPRHLCQLLCLILSCIPVPLGLLASPRSSHIFFFQSRISEAYLRHGGEYGSAFTAATGATGQPCVPAVAAAAAAAMEVQAVHPPATLLPPLPDMRELEALFTSPPFGALTPDTFSQEVRSSAMHSRGSAAG